jgi:hypothetical protein
LSGEPANIARQPRSGNAAVETPYLIVNAMEIFAKPSQSLLLIAQIEAAPSDKPIRKLCADLLRSSISASQDPLAQDESKRALHPC